MPQPEKKEELCPVAVALEQFAFDLVERAFLEVASTSAEMGKVDLAINCASAAKMCRIIGEGAHVKAVEYAGHNFPSVKFQQLHDLLSASAEEYQCARWKRREAREKKH